MVYLIDNYDSFSYNLYQYVGELAAEIKVVRNDELSCKQLEALRPSHIILSPGPGRPADAGICEEAVKYFEGKLPILGVCLGHQGICEAYGATVTYAPKLMHGKQSEVSLEHSGKGDLFAHLPKTIKVARYHSLIAEWEGFPEELSVIAKTAENEIMAVRHKKYPTYGVQFHPESILTPEGKTILKNFLEM